MEVQENRIQERNREIGLILREAREQKNTPITACANLVGTSRRRYVAMEEGKAIIGIAELEVLMEFLGISSHKVWPVKDALDIPRQFLLKALPGEKLQIVVDVRE